MSLKFTISGARVMATVFMDGVLCRCPGCDGAAFHDEIEPFPEAPIACQNCGCVSTIELAQRTSATGIRFPTTKPGSVDETSIVIC
jgi:hypothetical protein